MLPTNAYYALRNQARGFLASARHWRGTQPARAQACWRAAKLCLRKVRLELV